MKRILDLIASGVGLIILFPVVLLIAILIKMDSKGPVFFRQVRVGKNNKDFRMFKFRTMHTGSDKGRQITVGDRDPRVTRVGYYIRKLKLDELAQLINVFIGDMSLVGPRPEVRKFVNYYSEEQMKVLTVRPGITDQASIQFVGESELLAQANDPETYYIEEIMPKKLNLNLEYIRDQSFFGDIKLIFRTFFAILKK
ncbi:sugar transferase [Roseivirga sp. BDSF3-8]|uniref:sugar transferase n=1 Tax=Roseivirga sp. BDSF3-8 TaxID=3241598 RepID=UPI00353262B4